MSKTKAVKTADGKCVWSGPVTGAFLPQLPDRWPSEWSESELPADEAIRRLMTMWDSDIEALSLPILAQRSERIGMQGWFGERVTPGTGPNGRRYAPDLYAATFAWLEAEQAYRAVVAAEEATQAAKDAAVAATNVAKVAAVIAAVAVVVAVLQLLFGG